MKTDDVTVNGVRIGGAEAVEAGDTRMVELPSGARAEVRKGMGRDLMRAQRAVAGGDASAVVFALVGEVGRNGGGKIGDGDLVEVGPAGVMGVQAEVIGENFEHPPQRASQGSSNPGSQPES